MQTVPLHLARPQVVAPDGHLLVGRVAVESDHFHPVEQRPGNRVRHVGGGEEQHLGQVELHVEVVILEGMVLRGVEHLEQRRRRIAAPVRPQLVDLVEQDHRVHRARVPQGAHEPAGQGADVGAAMPADLGLVADAAQGHADELPAGGPGDRLADRRLAGPRRADQGQDGARPAIVREAALRAQLPDGQVFGDAPLHVVEAGVIGVQHLARVLRIQALLRSLRPRHREQPVQIGPDHRPFGVRLPHPLEPRQLALGLLLDRLRHGRVGDLLPILLGHRALVLAELLADRLHLPAQQVLALLLLRPRLHLVANALPDAQLRQPVLLEPEGEGQPLDHVQGLEQLQLLFEVQVRGVAGRVRQGARMGDGADEGADPAVVAAELEDLLHHRPVLALELARQARRGGRVRTLVDLHAQDAVRLGCARRRARPGAAA